MKRFITIFIILLLTSFCFAEKKTFKTGEAFQTSISDFFYPVDINVTGSKCSVTSIKKVEKDLWCLRIAAWRGGAASAPVIYDYYVKVGDTLKFRRINDPLVECELKVISINWNEIEIDIQ